jgi:cytochrome c oxidase cbb3-type subunit 3
VISGVSDSGFYLIMIFITLEFIIVFGLLFNIARLHRLLKHKDAEDFVAVGAPAPRPRSWFWDEFNAAASLEKEKDVLLDHNYDGIQELDNSLPPWWKYGFYFTIVFAVIYLFRYEVTHSAPNALEEYNIEMAQGEADKAAYLAKAGNAIDETNVTLLTDATSMAEAKDLFLKNCLPCHLADGGGIVGPNLTDDYWLHGCGIKDIFKTIKYGYMDKGMKSWKDDFSPKQIQELASYVKSLRGTKPANPKAPQGDLCTDGAAPAAAPAAAAPAADTTKKK